MNYIWLVQRLYLDMGWLPHKVCLTKKEAKEEAKYFNGFAHKTKDARYRIRKYIDAKT
jgi:hypothetical protein